MRSGLECDDWDGRSPGNESRVYRSADWVKYVLDLPMVEPPGTRGRYCSGNVLVAGRIVERQTGKPLLAFAQENLFTPLGIRARDVRWDFTLTSSNAATFAQLYLRRRHAQVGGALSPAGELGWAQVICASGSRGPRRGGRPSGTRSTDTSGGTSGSMRRRQADHAAWTWLSRPATAGRRSTWFRRSISSSC